MPRNPFPVRKTVYLSLTCLCFLLGLCRALLVLVQWDGAMPFLFCLIVSSLALGSCALQIGRASCRERVFGYV